MTNKLPEIGKIYRALKDIAEIKIETMGDIISFEVRRPSQPFATYGEISIEEFWDEFKEIPTSKPAASISEIAEKKDLVKNCANKIADHCTTSSLERSYNKGYFDGFEDGKKQEANEIVADCDDVKILFSDPAISKIGTAEEESILRSYLKSNGWDKIKVSGVEEDSQGIWKDANEIVEKANKFTKGEIGEFFEEQLILQDAQFATIGFYDFGERNFFSLCDRDRPLRIKRYCTLTDFLIDYESKSAEIESMKKEISEIRKILETKNK